MAPQLVNMEERDWGWQLPAAWWMRTKDILKCKASTIKAALSLYCCQLRGKPDERIYEMKRILVVDDDPDIRVLEEKILKREGYEVTTASNGKAAIEAIKTKEFDLVLLDIMMPGIDGFEVSRFFRRELEDKNMPVVFVTAKDDADSKR